jgi:Tfp pilus assembly protein PilN
MRELEFLPNWYPTMRTRKRWVAMQAWLTLVIAVALGLWLLLVQRNVHARERELSDVSMALDKSQGQVERLDQLLELQKTLGRKDQIFAKIGRPVESTRLLTTLDELMPPDMSLLDFAAVTEEPPPVTIAAKAAAEKGTPVRRLKIKLRGVAPTDADLACFLAKLSSRPIFSNVSLGYSQQRVDNGRLMREFEVNFAIELGGLSGGGGN